MSDDLFWPPLFGDDDDEDRPTEALNAPDSDATEATEVLPERERAMADASAGPTRSRRAVTAAVVGVTAFAFGAGGVAVGAAVVHHHDDNSSTPASSGSVSNGAVSALATSRKTYAGIAAKVLPSVVSVNVTGANESDTGSGVVLQSNGYILTNNHVVAAAASSGSVSVAFNDGTSAAAKIIGTDSLDDLAVIKVDKTGLSAATLGDSSTIHVGDPVLAIGSPLGLTGTVTSGIVSALNRPVETQEESQTSPFGQDQTTNPTVIDAIQTDAAINPGNSGGALVDSSGAVIGINSAIASLGSSSLGSSQSGNIGVGFAIPINQAKTIANELISTGQATHPLLGISLTDQNSTTGIDRAVVHSVTAGGAAEMAGLKAGDVITDIDGIQTDGADAVIAAIRSHQPGQQVAVTYERDGSSHTVTATLTAQPTSQQG